VNTNCAAGTPRYEFLNKIAKRNSRGCVRGERPGFSEGFTPALQNREKAGKTRALQTHELLSDNDACKPASVFLDCYKNA